MNEKYPENKGHFPFVTIRKTTNIAIESAEMYQARRRVKRGEHRLQELLSLNQPKDINLQDIIDRLHEMGGNIRMARLRRKWPARVVCLRACISRTTLYAVEKGHPQVGIGVYARVLFVLGLEHGLAKWGEDDKVGQKIRDEELRIRKMGRWPKISDLWD